MEDQGMGRSAEAKWGRGLTVWLLIMAIETVHGIARSWFLVPAVGQAEADMIGWPIGAAIVLGTALAGIGWTKISGRRDLLVLGALWAVLTLAFELLIGALRGLDALALANAVNPVAGGTIAYSMAVMLFAPAIAARIRAWF
jgi:hypothetical protein